MSYSDSADLSLCAYLIIPNSMDNVSRPMQKLLMFSRIQYANNKWQSSLECSRNVLVSKMQEIFFIYMFYSEDQYVFEQCD